MAVTPWVTSKRAKILKLMKDYLETIHNIELGQKHINVNVEAKIPVNAMVRDAVESEDVLNEKGEVVMTVKKKKEEIEENEQT